MKIKVYSDGGISRDIGGWASMLLVDEQPHHAISGVVKGTTSNRMELTGIIEGFKEALTLADESCEFEIISDSQYCILGASERWNKWVAQGRFKPDSKLTNLDLWLKIKEIKELEKKHKITWTWIRGHVGHRWNECCDLLCKDAYTKFKESHLTN